MAIFSIIIPVYNAQEWLEECLNSIIKQSFTDFEIVIVNDGSSDESLTLINKIKEANSQLKWVVESQENKGLGFARNKAVDLASGQWLAFLDSDDYWSCHKLLQCSDFIKQHNCDWFYHEVYEKYTNGRMRERKAFEFNSLDEWISKGNPIVPSATVIKRSIFLKHNGFDEARNRVEDLGLWFRLFQAKKFPLFLDETSTVYRLGSGLTTNAEDHDSKLMIVVNEAKEKNILSQSQLDNVIDRKKYEFARQYHKSGEFNKALKNYQILDANLKIRCLIFLAKLKISM